jgi:hypothetical protein
MVPGGSGLFLSSSSTVMVLSSLMRRDVSEMVPRSKRFLLDAVSTLPVCHTTSQTACKYLATLQSIHASNNCAAPERKATSNSDLQIYNRSIYVGASRKPADRLDTHHQCSLGTRHVRLGAADIHLVLAYANALDAPTLSRHVDVG